MNYIYIYIDKDKINLVYFIRFIHYKLVSYDKQCLPHSSGEFKCEFDVHEADHSSLKFMLIDQHHSEVLKSENFWIGMLLTNRKGLNGSHDFAHATIVIYS